MKDNYFIYKDSDFEQKIIMSNFDNISTEEYYENV